MKQITRIAGLVACLGAVACLARPSTPQPDPVAVDPLFGAIVPPGNYISLTFQQRWTLFLRQSFTNPGAYIRTLGPAIGDQIQDKKRDHTQPD